MPISDKKFDLKQKAIVTICTPNLVTFGIDPLDFGLLAAPKAIWDPAYAAGNREMGLTRSTLQVESKDLSRGVYEPVINKFVAGCIKNNSHIPDVQKLAMYIHIDTHSIHHNVRPATLPVKYTMDLNASQHIKIDFLDSVSGKAGKPDGVLRLESWVFIQEPKIGPDGHVILDTEGNIVYTVPLVDEDYHHWGLDSSTMDVDLEFVLSDAGKGVYIRNRYANNVDHGDFGETIITTIPR